ncbi:MAG: hypothetical protein NXI17_14055 [Alphaproteobacteria bacterium]|nr:hypothetical protein [Alphaproteobacteria bacterium]
MKFTAGTLASAAVILMSCVSSYAVDMADGSYGMPTKVYFGEIEARLGGIWIDGFDEGIDEEMLFGGAALRVGKVIDNRWVIQGDIFGELTDSNHRNSYAYGLGGAVHVAKRSDTHLLGIFGGYLHTDQDTPDDSETSGRVFAGVEAQRYYDQTTLYGQLGWIDGQWGSDDDGYDSLSNAVFARAMVRYFVNPATRLDLSAAAFYGQMDDDFSDEVKGGSLTAGIEHQIHDSDFSIFSGYEIGYYNQNEDGHDELVEQTVWAGLKYRFGVDGTLKQQDRDRPSLDLPPLLRWMAQTAGPLD